MSMNQPPTTLLAEPLMVRQDDQIQQHEYQRLRVADIHTPKFQRDIHHSLVRRMAKNFSWDTMLALVVYQDRESDLYYVIDGQQRLEALRALGRELDLVPCLVYRHLSYADAARLYADIQRAGARKVLTPADVFKAKLEAGEAQAWEIADLCDELGITINLNTHDSRPRGLRAIATVERIQRVGGTASLRRVLTLLISAWPDDNQAMDGKIIEGLAVLLRRYPTLTDDALRERFVSITPLAVLRKAAALRDIIGTNVITCVARALHAHYNVRRRTNALPPWDERASGVGDAS